MTRTEFEQNILKFSKKYHTTKKFLKDISIYLRLKNGVDTTEFIKILSDHKKFKEKLYEIKKDIVNSENDISVINEIIKLIENNNGNNDSPPDLFDESGNGNDEGNGLMQVLSSKHLFVYDKNTLINLIESIDMEFTL